MQSEPGAVATEPKSNSTRYPVATAPGSDLIRLEFRPMKIADESITLRPVDETDEGFLIELYKSSRGDDLRGLGWSEDRISEFFERLGFRRTSETGTHFQMEWLPEAVSSQTVRKG